MCSNILRNLSRINRLFANRCYSTDSPILDGPHIIPMGKSDLGHSTTVSFLSKDMNDEKLVGVRGLSKAGFRLYDGSFLYGPIAVFPKTCLSWRVVTPDDITPESLELFFMLQPKIDILVVGVGERKDLDKVRSRISPALKKHNIGLEIMPTEDAIPTFNFLNAEMRYVAAALYPPKDLVVTDEEYKHALNYMKDYYEMDENPLLIGLSDNYANPAEDIVKRIWGYKDPKVIKKVNQLAAENARMKAERIRQLRRIDIPEKETNLIANEDDTKKLKDK